MPDSPESVNIHYAKTHLSRLLEGVSRGESFVIAKAGKPVASVLPYRAEEPAPLRRLGFLEGQFQVPDDFDHLQASAARDGGS
jgi:prevent-host-death family protein